MVVAMGTELKKLEDGMCPHDQLLETLFTILRERTSISHVGSLGQKEARGIPALRSQVA